MALHVTTVQLSDIAEAMNRSFIQGARDKEIELIVVRSTGLTSIETDTVSYTHLTLPTSG